MRRCASEIVSRAHARARAHACCRLFAVRRPPFGRTRMVVGVWGDESARAQNQIKYNRINLASAAAATPLDVWPHARRRRPRRRRRWLRPSPRRDARFCLHPLSRASAAAAVRVACHRRRRRATAFAPAAEKQQKLACVFSGCRLSIAMRATPTMRGTTPPHATSRQVHARARAFLQ